MKYSSTVSASRRKCRKVRSITQWIGTAWLPGHWLAWVVYLFMTCLHARAFGVVQGVPGVEPPQAHRRSIAGLQSVRSPLAFMLPGSQAHFTAPSSERRKLMSAPLSTDLRNKYSVSSSHRPPGGNLEAGAAGPDCRLIKTHEQWRSLDPAGPVLMRSPLCACAGPVHSHQEGR